MKTTIWNDREVVLTAGVNMATGTQVFGVFASEADAMSENADALAIAVVAADQLTAEQIADAEENADEVSA